MQIAFMDLADSTGCPSDVTRLVGVDETLLQDLYDVGARVMSNSWGCPNGTYITNGPLDLQDKYLQLHNRHWCMLHL
jgi:hypothetical protein